MAQSVTAVWSNVYAVCQSLFPGTATAPVLVSFGDPGNYQPDIIVAVMGGHISIGQPTSGTGRSREKTCEVPVIISVFVPGSDPSAQAAWVTAQGMADQLEAYFRTSPNETLSGACREALMTVADVVLSNARDPASGNQTGSIAEITCTITAHVRI